LINFELQFTLLFSIFIIYYKIENQLIVVLNSASV